MLNYFVILNVTENAEAEVIKASYKALAKKYHPDNTSLSKKDSENYMLLINEAYQVLSNEKTRMEYIKKLHNLREYDGNFKYTPMEENVYGNSKGYKSDISNEKNENNNSTDNVYKNGYNCDKLNPFNCIVSVLIIICILYCIIYFAPDVLKNISYDIQNEFKKIIDTFK